MENGVALVGMYVEPVGGGTFTMNGGTISGNSVSGISISNKGSFTMNDGIISGNGGSETLGGGVYVENGTFTMNGGTISGYTASLGGGVCIGDSGVFIKTGGTITADNRSIKYSGMNVVGSNRNRRNSAAWPSVRLDSRIAGSAGGWE